MNPRRDFEESVDDAFTDLIRFFPTYARLNSLTERPGYDTQVETKPPPGTLSQPSARCCWKNGDGASRVYETTHKYISFQNHLLVV